MNYTHYIIGCMIIFTCSMHALPKEWYVNDTLAQILGTNAASPEIQKITREALHHFEVKKPNIIPIRCIDTENDWLDKYMSFSLLYGIWFNEDALSSCKQCQIWHAYHEAAHYALMHSQKLIGSSALMIVGGLPLFKNITKIATTSSMLQFVLAGAATEALLYILLPEIAKKFEEQANKKAADMLCLLGHIDVLEDQIRHLHNMDIEHSSRWLPSVPNQLAILEKTLSQHNKKGLL